MVHPHLERSIESLRRRAFVGAFLGTFLRHLAITAAILAAVALFLRVVLRVERVDAAWTFAPLALVPIVAWVLARRRVPSRATAAAWLDVRAGGSGAIVAGDEVRDPRWQAELERALARQPALPRVDVGRPASLAACALAFGGLALAVPITPVPVGPPTLVQESVLERVEEQLKALEEQVDLEPEVAAELRETLERLQREGALAEPEAAFEALDRAQERLEQEAYERAEAAQSAQDQLAQAGLEADADPEAAQERLEKTLAGLAQSGFSKDVRSALEKEIGAAGVALPPGTKLTAENIEAISKALAEKLGERGGELAKSGLLDAKALAKLGELAKLDAFEFKPGTCKGGTCEGGNCDSTCERDAEGVCTKHGTKPCAHGSKPGRGGISRGRADAELTWGEETPGSTDAFEPKSLPDGQYADPEHSAIVGVGAAAPPIDARAEAPGAGAIEASGGQTAWRRRLAPHHRDAVKAWFGPGGR